MVMSGVVPRTLWLPKQLERARIKAQKRRRKSETDLGVEEASSPRALIGSGHQGMRYLASRFSLYPAWLDTFFPSTIPIPFISGRVSKRLNMLDLDDFAIVRDGGSSGLLGEEIQMACDMRGIDGDEGKTRAALEKWLQHGHIAPSDLIQMGKT